MFDLNKFCSTVLISLSGVINIVLGIKVSSKCFKILYFDAFAIPPKYWEGLLATKNEMDLAFKHRNKK